MPNELATQVIDLLSPSVGRYIARLQITVACSMAKLDIERLTTDELKPLSDRIELIYEAKFGQEIAKNVKTKILSILHETSLGLQTERRSIDP